MAAWLDLCVLFELYVFGCVCLKLVIVCLNCIAEREHAHRCGSASCTRRRTCHAGSPPLTSGVTNILSRTTGMTQTYMQLVPTSERFWFHLSPPRWHGLTESAQQSRANTFDSALSLARHSFAMVTLRFVRSTARKGVTFEENC